MFLHVIKATYLDTYRLEITFNNDAVGIVDLKSELYGEIFEPLKDVGLFQKFKITNRTIEWPNGADFAPEFLYQHAQLTTQPNPASTILIPQID